MSLLRYSPSYAPLRRMRLTFCLRLSLEYEERFNRYAKNDRGEPLAVMPHLGRSLYARMRRAVAVPPRSRAGKKSGTGSPEFFEEIATGAEVPN